MIINPSTGKFADPAWVKFQVIRKYNSYGNYLPKSVYEDTLFLSNGIVCGGLLQDTFRRRVLKDSYIFKKISDTSSDDQYIPIDTSFTDASNVKEINSDVIKLYPVPTYDKLYIEFPYEYAYKIKFYNSISEQVEIPQVENNTFDVSFLKSGIYIAIIQIGEQELMKNFIIDPRY